MQRTLSHFLPSQGGRGGGLPGGIGLRGPRSVTVRTPQRQLWGGFPSPFPCPLHLLPAPPLPPLSSLVGLSGPKVQDRVDLEMQKVGEGDEKQSGGTISALSWMGVGWGVGAHLWRLVASPLVGLLLLFLSHNPSHRDPQDSQASLAPGPPGPPVSTRQRLSSSWKSQAWVTAWWVGLPCPQGAHPQAPQAASPRTHVCMESPGHTPDRG